jgi:hypothetical protein
MLGYREDNQQQLTDGLSRFYQHAGLQVQFNDNLIMLYQESVAFLMYSLTEEIITCDVKSLESNKQSIMVRLGSLVKNSG